MFLSLIQTGLNPLCIKSITVIAMAKFRCVNWNPFQEILWGNKFKVASNSACLIHHSQCVLEQLLDNSLGLM